MGALHRPIRIFNKNQIGGKDMESKNPKRRKDRYNPYTIYKRTGHYYISFKDGQGDFYKIEISKALYDTFDLFELDDLL